MMEDLVVGVIYMGYFSGFMLLACLLSWLCENVPFFSRLMDRLLEYTSLSYYDEDDDEYYDDDEEDDYYV